MKSPKIVSLEKHLDFLERIICRQSIPSELKEYMVKKFGPNVISEIKNTPQEKRAKFVGKIRKALQILEEQSI